jgi:starch synthase
VKVVFVASEGVPFSKTGGLADVVGALPKALAALGHEVEVILPRYRTTPQGAGVPHARSLTLPLGSGYKFAAVQGAGRTQQVQTYLIDCPELFDRDGLYQHKGEDYPDNAHRFAAFSLAALEFLKHSATPPDVIHCHDWQTALVPIYLRNLYPGDSYFARTSIMFTLHNLGYQGLFLPHLLPQISLHAGLFTVDALEYYGMVNLLKGGIIFSDFITTVSRKYAEEIQTPEFGYGLEGVLHARADHLQGILNGVDYDEWNPATDKYLAANYTPANLKGKEACKRDLLEKMGARSPVLSRPVIGIVSRFASQKGFDLIAAIAEKLAALDLYIVALGTGEPVHEELFRTMAAKHPDKFLVRIAYDNALAHQIEAGSDMFLMPSKYEPCGLNQIYSLKYGAVPVVRATGGLDDTIEHFDGKSGTGFKFHDYSPQALLATIQEALDAYQNSETWHHVMQNGMKKDYSWTTSAREYSQIYEALKKAKA